MPGLKRTALPGAMVTSAPVRGIAADAGFAWLDGEDAKATELDAVASDEGLLHAVEDCVNRSLCFGSWQAGALNNPLYKILLNHLGRRPWAVIL